MRISTITITLTVEHDCGDNEELMQEAVTNSLAGLEMRLDEDATSHDMPATFRVLHAESDVAGCRISCGAMTVEDLRAVRN